MSLRRGVAWTTVGSSAYLVTQYAMLTVLAKLGSPVLVGQFALAFGITAPVVILSQMQLRQLQVTDVRGTFLFGDYFFARLTLSVVALSIIGTIIALAGYSAQLNVIIALIGLAKVFESLSDIVHGKLQQHQRMDCIARSLVLKGTLSVGLFAAVLWATGSLIWAVSGLAGVWGGVLVAYDFRVLRRVVQRSETFFVWRPRALVELTLLALPLALAAGLGSLGGNMSRYFLDAFGGPREVGLFAVATAPLSVVVLLGGAIAQATLRPAAESFESGTFGTFRGLATRITLAQVGLAAACTVFFGLFGERLLTTLFAPDYGVGAPILTIMSAGLMISGLGAFGSAVLAAGRMWWLQCANVAIALAAHIPLCYYLIGASATRGAAWAEVGRMLVSTLFLAVAGWWAFRRQRSRSTASPPDPQPGGGDGIHT